MSERPARAGRRRGWLSRLWLRRRVRARRTKGRWVRRTLLALLIVFIGLPFALTLIYRVVPPPVTPLMVIRLFEGEGLDKSWRSLEEISPHAGQAVIAAEDNLFCHHHGIDWEAVGTALEDYSKGKRLRGASTITMQTAKNLFLWPDRHYLRKALEVYLALFLDAFLPKRRIIEIYLNIAELGPGIYGVEAAAQHHFGVPAGKLSRRQAALLAAVLPNPRERSASAPSAGVRRKADTVALRIRQLGELLDCARPDP